MKKKTPTAAELFDKLPIVVSLPPAIQRKLVKHATDLGIKPPLLIRWIVSLHYGKPDKAALKEISRALRRKA